jgi:hypothetical protein
VLKPTYVKKKEGELIIRKEALLKSSQKSLYEEEKAKKLNKPGGNDWISKLIMLCSSMQKNLLVINDFSIPKGTIDIK